MPSAFPSIVSLISSAGIAAKTILGILLVCSIVSWGIILYKIAVFRKATKENRWFLTHLAKSQSLQSVRSAVVGPHSGPLWRLSRNLIEFMDPHLDWEQGALRDPKASPDTARVERTLKSSMQDELDYYEEAVHMLATIGNTTPFIGLLGTVWSIMNTFRSIGLQESASMATVAPGIAEALVATAAGLATAIPAVVAYNIFVNRLRRMETQLGIFAAELMERVDTLSRTVLSKQEVVQK